MATAAPAAAIPQRPTTNGLRHAGAVTGAGKAAIVDAVKPLSAI